MSVSKDVAATAALSRDSLVFLDKNDLKVIHINPAAKKQLADAQSVLRAGTEIKQFLAYLAKNGEFSDGDAVGSVRQALASISSASQADLPGFRLGKAVFTWHCDAGPGDTIALVLRDGGKAQELARALADHKIFIQHLIDVLPIPVYLKNRDSVVTRCNGAFAELFGLQVDDVIGKKLIEVAPDSLAKTIAEHEKPLLIAEGQVRDDISFVLDDKERAALFAASSLKGPSGSIAGTIGSLVDVTSLKKAQAEVAEAADRLTGLLESAPIGVGISNRETGVFQFFNSTFAKMLDLEEEKDPTDSILLSERYRQQSLKDMDMVGELHDVEIRLRRPQMAEAKWLKTSLEPLSFEGEESVLWWTSDITKQKHAARELQNKANNDELTGLANRARFMQKLEQCENVLRGTNTPASLFILDLDGFKNLNDTKGHAAGDWLLTETSKRLKRAGRRAEEVARLGGDEFTMLFINKGREKEMCEIAGAILAELNQPFMWKGEDCGVSASIGFSVFDGGHCDMNEQLRRADKAMYQAKAAGKAQYCLYTPELEPELHHD
ncbi:MULTISPECIES: diguanylate cyclase domain-containing protein [Thalassospira]|uniref:Diguanylate cyclase n=1 Tax=Thalassospira aquimaris TaxID=3037796 RepID=A0ABT6GI75_9PROT|nr:MULTISPECIES: diguanylate cyclase [Thalassospira]MDG4721729.1 diguanylate cyclase [Thalassospira sp. FZY0004]